MTSSAVPSQRVPVFTLQDRLRKAREEGGLDQKDLADALGSTRQMISNYETGFSPYPRHYLLVAWAMACDVDLDWLIGDYPGPPRRTRKDSSTVPYMTNYMTVCDGDGQTTGRISGHLQVVA